MMSFQKGKWWKNHQNYCKLYCQVKKCFLVACAELREIIFLHYIIYQQPIYLLSYYKLFLKAEPATRVDTFNLGLWLQRAGMRERGLNGAGGKGKKIQGKNSGIKWFTSVMATSCRTFSGFLLNLSQNCRLKGWKKAAFISQQPSPTCWRPLLCGINIPVPMGCKDRRALQRQGTIASRLPPQRSRGTGY